MTEKKDKPKGHWKETNAPIPEYKFIPDPPGIQMEAPNRARKQALDLLSVITILTGVIRSEFEE